jgi:hypothetical protein
MSDDSPELKELLLLVCPLCQREGRWVGRAGVIGKVFSVKSGNLPMIMYRSSYREDDDDGPLSKLAVKVNGRWIDARPDFEPDVDTSFLREKYPDGVPDIDFLEFVSAGCQHGMVSVATRILDAELDRRDRTSSRRPRILIVPNVLG